MQLVLSWPVRLFVIAVLIISLFVDGAGYVYRIANKLPLTGNVAGLPPNFGGLQLYFHKGLDLAGGTHIDYQMRNCPKGQNRSDVQQRTIAVINKRVNSLGVSEPEIRGAGSHYDRITVDLAGVNAEQAQKTIGAVSRLVYTKWIPDSQVTNGPDGGAAGFKPALTGLTGDDISNAVATIDQTGVSWVVNITFTSKGADTFDRLTRDNVAACPGDTATVQSANDLATGINSGSLPVDLVTLDVTQVSATLGAESVKLSIAAALLGLAIVVLFMIVYYRVPGFLASLALLFYAGAVLAVFKLVPVTLTLACITGFILSVGMAVDANVLIFERFKEEVRAGRTITAAVDAAVRRGGPPNRDSNTSTIITCIILGFVGPAAVKGFAVTLAIGVLASLVSSIGVTHNLLAIVLAGSGLRRAGLLGGDRVRAA